MAYDKLKDNDRLYWAVYTCSPACVISLRSNQQPMAVASSRSYGRQSGMFRLNVLCWEHLLSSKTRTASQATAVSSRSTKFATGSRPNDCLHAPRLAATGTHKLPISFSVMLCTSSSSRGSRQMICSSLMRDRRGCGTCCWGTCGHPWTKLSLASCFAAARTWQI